MLCILSFGLLFAGCNTLKQTATHDLTNGYYKLVTAGEKQNIYAAVEDSVIRLYPLLSEPGKQPDTTQHDTLFTIQPGIGGIATPVKLIKHSIDLDITTILLKYRFANSTLPNQLNANLNAALYLGYRKDLFMFHDTRDPLHRSKRNISHFEFDMGVFAGIGITPVNPSVTGGRVEVEYDGVIFQKGVAFFLGSHQLTLGLGLGFDGLLDQNKDKWIYQEKPWLGLMIGLNLGG